MTAEPQIVLHRVLDAPRETVWQAWTQAGHIAKWWGPQGFSTTIHEMDVRPGGEWRYIMHGPDGTDYPNKVTYLEVEKPSRLVFLLSDDYEDPDKNEHFRSVVTFDERDGKTEITMRMVFDSPEEYQRVVKFGAVEGGESTLDCLEAHLKTM